ncbi:transglycosylase SLT domain-containing protein [Photobacterium carnosum]|uniref:transglycosylase SLT domain-containing protein n=1 Tax=Photobacterium carnosum TaxID=2023717 RepID=UPI001E533B66|nr:transglycosylase SLT domain-containing protein [Photobacterium carnosum]MCD9554430.1 transglycosylase SLT domain-containing protein [Photobacterium carnosum]
MSKQFRYFVLALALGVSTVPHANAKKVQVPSAFKKIASSCNVPSKNLFAIALTETETGLKNGRSSPWAWTINHKGKSYFYPNRKSLYIAAQRLIDRKQLLFDIGIMQVNWRWHKDRVKSLWEMTAPETNVRVGCEILREGYMARGNWIDAAAYYHSPGNKKAASQYKKRYKDKLARTYN